MLYKITRAIARVFFYLLVGRTKIIGKENMKTIEEGPAIICANHKSNWDPVILGDTFRRPICFMAKKSLFKNKLMGAFLLKTGSFPVDRNTNDFAAIKKAIKVLRADQLLGIFPEGKRSDDGYVHEFKQGLPLIAHKTKAKILPVGITNKVGFWNRPVVQIGEPIDLGEFYEQKSDAELFDKMNEIIHKQVSILAYPEKEKLNG